MELLDSRRDTFNKEIKEREPITRSTTIEARGPKGRSQDSQDQVSFQENHLLGCEVPKGGSLLKSNYGHFLVFVFIKQSSMEGPYLWIWEFALRPGNIT